MTEYRRKDLDLSTRIFLGIEMLRPAQERGWGRASELARKYGISRSLLYQFRGRVQEALAEALKPKPAGRPPKIEVMQIDRDTIRKAIAVMPLLTGAVRSIQMGLELLFGVHRSVGYISQTLQAAGAAAEAQNGKLQVSLPVLGEADEIFAGRKPCLTVVDGRSFLALNLSAAEGRDATHWGLTFLDLEARGVVFQDLAADGARGIRAGLQEAEPAIPLRPDLFHLLREAHHLTQRLERKAYKAIETAERARRADLEARGIIRRRGRRLKIKVPLPQAEKEETKAIELFDNWHWLLGEIRQTLEPFTPDGHLRSVKETKATFEAALEPLEELGHMDITAFATDLREKLPELLAPLEWLEQQLRPLLEGFDAGTQAFIIWAWQHRRELDLNIDTDIPEELRSVVRTVWDLLGLFHRSSSLAESLHSWLRPYLQIHRGMPEWLLPLLQLFWNHHEFRRGKRAGSSPLELAGVQDAPSLAEVLERLFHPPETAAQPA